ncbi:hypothetical protein F4824DRAFT_71426 [Ustulina deusta]|nr:hypothetical protein F4824DRAFT_71426 [Ustulina deusta]
MGETMTDNIRLSSCYSGKEYEALGSRFFGGFFFVTISTGAAGGVCRCSIRYYGHVGHFSRFQRVQLRPIFSPCFSFFSCFSWLEQIPFGDLMKLGRENPPWCDIYKFFLYLLYQECKGRVLVVHDGQYMDNIVCIMECFGDRSSARFISSLSVSVHGVWGRRRSVSRKLPPSKTPARASRIG